MTQLQQEQQQPLNWSTSDRQQPFEGVDDTQYTYPSGVTEPREGSEMLLVRLTDTHPNQAQTRIVYPTNKIIYFGNHSVFASTIQKASGGSPLTSSPETPTAQNATPRVHYAIPETLDQWPHDVPVESLDTKMEELNSLQRRGAFDMPSIEVQQALLETYFSVVYPTQRILDKEQFLQDHKAGTASKLLLQLLFLMATYYCDESLINAHWGTRRMANYTFFARAKALYDADFEQNRVTLVQSLFLMCFWWDSPTEQKDFSHWLGAAIRFAQANGMHRSTKHSGMPARQRRLWKRIWWALYVRDHFDAASVGRPMQIHDDDCDIEPLALDDFADGDDDGVRTSVKDRNSALHAVEMAKLAVLIGGIVRPVPQNTADSSSERMRKKLNEWEESLARDLTYHEEEQDPQKKALAGNLCLAFHFCKIMVNRRIFLESNSAPEAYQHALTSVNTITRVVEDLLTEDLLRRINVHVIASLFSCVTILVTLLHQSENARRKVFQHKMQLCLLALGELSRQWPFVGWMYNLFRHLGERLRVEDNNVETAGRAASNNSGLGTLAPESAECNLAINTEATQNAAPGSRKDVTSTADYLMSTPEIELLSDLPSFDVSDPFASFRTMDWMSQPIDLESAAWAWPLPSSSSDLTMPAV